MINKDQPKQAVIYCRSPFPPGFGEDGALIEQRERCEFYATHYDIGVLEVFIDYSEEPACLRDGFAAMCNFLEQNIGNDIAVLVEDFLRIADTPSDMRQSIELLEDTYHAKVYDFAAIGAPTRQHRARYEVEIHRLLSSMDEYFQLHSEQVQQFVMDITELKQQAEVLS